VWGRKHDDLLVRTGGMPTRLVRLEDGFIRSVGLGADLVRPLSWVQDDVGIYYDATAPSRLENLLRETKFDSSLLNRAQNLIELILASNITKYNLSDAVPWERPQGFDRVLLVPGQVESDASIKYGGSVIRRNLELLRAVRVAHPSAYIVYKPHPDVVARLRDAGDGESEASKWCDRVLLNVPLHDILTKVDEVHTMTSLTGFEALLRGLRVSTYGQPFYAGWGLTQDCALNDAVLARRGRLLNLPELVAAVLILYPAYISRSTGKFTTPEHAIEELVAWRSEAPATPRWRRIIAQLFRKV